MSSLATVLVIALGTAPAGQGGPPLDPAMARVSEAQTLIKAGDLTGALARLDEARRIGTRPVPVALWMAVVHARLKNPDAAFAELMKAAGVGLGALPPPIATDPAVAALKSDARFAALQQALDRNARPCEHDPVYRQFDYWIGEWDVRPNGSPGAPPATNVVTKIHNGCVILESWTAPGQTGQSFNIYDRVSGKWHQAWVDSSGGLHQYVGSLVDGNMTYEGDIPAPRGQGSGRMHVRLTFFKQPDGSVRQYSERTPDGGKTWQVNYDLIYTRRK